MERGIFVKFVTNHKMVDSGISREIEVKLEVPKYYPNGKELSMEDIEQYVKIRYGFDILRLV